MFGRRTTDAQNHRSVLHGALGNLVVVSSPNQEFGNMAVRESPGSLGSVEALVLLCAHNRSQLPLPTGIHSSPRAFPALGVPFS